MKPNGTFRIPGLWLALGLVCVPGFLPAAGLATRKKLPGRSLLPLALGKEVPAWREYVVVENNLSQTGTVDGMRPTMEGRMVRTDQYKYCVYNRGQQRESLVDMKADPSYRKVLLDHRELLTRFGQEHNDPLVAELLADNVKPIPFTAGDSSARKTRRKTK